MKSAEIDVSVCPAAVHIQTVLAPCYGASPFKSVQKGGQKTPCRIQDTNGKQGRASEEVANVPCPRFDPLGKDGTAQEERTLRGGAEPGRHPKTVA